MKRLALSPPKTVLLRSVLNVEVTLLTRHLIVVAGNVAAEELWADAAAGVVVGQGSVQCHQTENCSGFSVVE